MAVMIPAWVDGVLQPVEKLEAHLKGLRHKAVSVFLVAGCEVLIQRRALQKYHTPGLWANTCCTHPDWGEASDACALRRLEEELGIAGVHCAPRGQVEYRADVGGGMIEHEVVDLFRVDLGTRPEVRMNPDEVMAVDWVPLSELRARVTEAPEAFTPWLRIYLAEHGDAIFG